MGSLGNYLENELLDHVLGSSYTAPTIYVGLNKSDPTDAGTYDEPPTGDNYARVACSAWNTASSRTTANTNIVTFNQCQTTNWGTITHWFLSDSGTRNAGNCLAHGALAASKNVIIGNTPSIAAGEMDVTFTASGSGGGFSTFIANELLDHVFGVGAYTPPAIYVALCTSAPSDASFGTECTGNNYARKLHAAWNAASGGAADNSSVISFNTPSGTWGAVTHAGAFDALTVGNYLMWLDVADQTPASGDVVDFPSGDFNFTLN